jgi:hypothetical protein
MHSFVDFTFRTNLSVFSNFYKTFHNHNKTRIEKHTITHLCMEIDCPVLLPCIPQYVKEMHPNLDDDAPQAI